MELNSQFNAQFPDVEETMNKPMDDEKLVGIAFDSGLRFTDSESRESYRRFASFIIANAESEHRNALGEALAERDARTCEWTYDDSEDSWNGTCGIKWALTEGTPEENEMRFCPGCGAALKGDQSHDR